MTDLALLEASGQSNMSALADRIGSARFLLQKGDVREALLRAEGLYEEAKAAHGFAARMKASEELIAQTNAMVAEALEIGSLAKVALANEYDKAQAAGIVATRGRPKKVAGEDLLQLADFRLDKRVILDARKLRDAESKNPGVISRTIAVLSAGGVLPTKANLRAAIGTASASKADRGKNFYQTPRVATIALLAHESFTSTIWEPSCGFNAIGRVFEAQGYDVLLSDIEDRGTVSEAGDAQSVGDFLLSKPDASGDGPDIVTNPPYGAELNAFVAHALRVHKPRKMALLLNSNFEFGFDDDDRNFVMEDCAPSRIYKFKRRLPMMHREGYTGPEASSRMNTAWFIWERNEDGTYGNPDGWTKSRRIDWADYADVDVLEPGEGGHSLGIEFSDAPRTTPKLDLHERVDRDRNDALAWIGRRESFSRRELCSGIGRRDSTVEALIAEFEADGLVSPATEPGRDGRHVVLQAGQAVAA
ncbi:hypothetical protein [Nostoc phage Nsp-JY10]